MIFIIEKLIVNSEDNVKSLFKNIPIPTYVFQKVEGDLILIDYNNATEKITEGIIKEKLGNKVSKLFKDQLEHLKNLHRCIKERINFQKDIKISEKIYSINYCFIPPDLVIVHSEDITDRRQAKIELNRTHSELEQTFNISIPMCVIDKNYNIIKINDTLSSLFRIRMEDIVGKKCYDFLTGKFCKTAKCTIKQVVRGKKFYGYEKDIERSDGTKITCFLRGHPYRNLDGEIVGVIKYLLDITQYKRIEKELKQSEHALKERVKELTCLYGLSTLSEKPGISIKEIIQKTLDLITSAWSFPDNTCAKIIFDSKIFTTKRFKETKWKLSSNVSVGKKVMFIEVYYIEDKPFLVEEVDFLNDIAFRLKNIIECKEAEQKLIKINKELENKIQERTEKLKESEEKYRSAYHQANFYKDLFAHDINNILSNIKMSVELSSDCLDDPVKLKDLKEYYQIIHGQVLRAAKLISNVQKLSLLEETEILLEKVGVDKILNRAINYIIKSFQERNINIEIDRPDKTFYVKANHLLIDIFENILINAVNYNDKPKVEIRIRISEEEKEGTNLLKIEFIDNGIGIKDGRKKLIFQRGYKEEKGDKGLGFGLSLVNTIVDSYNGQIWVEDKVKGDYTKGSNFIILIPQVD